MADLLNPETATCERRPGEWKSRKAGLGLDVGADEEGRAFRRNPPLR